MKTITISDETYENIREQLGDEEKIDISSLEELIGKKLFLRTVTYHILGKVERVIGKLLCLSNASWVADSGRFMNAIKQGTLDEVEPVGNWAFVKSFNKRMLSSYRLVNGNDLVTCLPPWWLFYKHVGKKIKIGKWEFWKLFGSIRDHSIYEYKDNLRGFAILWKMHDRSKR